MSENKWEVSHVGTQNPGHRCDRGGSCEEDFQVLAGGVCQPRGHLLPIWKAVLGHKDPVIEFKWVSQVSSKTEGIKMMMCQLTILNEEYVNRNKMTQKYCWHVQKY